MKWKALILIVAAGTLVQAQLVERPLITARQAMVTSLEPLASDAEIRLGGADPREYGYAIGW